MKRIYIAHPYAEDPVWNRERVRLICQEVADQGHLPIAPQVYLPEFMNELTERDRALAYCLELVAICDEVWVYGKPSKGMRKEIDHAWKHGIPVKNVPNVVSTSLRPGRAPAPGTHPRNPMLMNTDASMHSQVDS